MFLKTGRISKVILVFYLKKIVITLPATKNRPTIWHINVSFFCPDYKNTFLRLGAEVGVCKPLSQYGKGSLSGT